MKFSVETSCNLVRIESVGSYSPDTKVGVADRVAAIGGLSFEEKNALGFAKRSGIASTNKVSKRETSFSLAKAAVTDCFSRSTYSPSEIDMVISCNISKIDHQQKFQLSPSYAIQLKDELGMSNAMVFDINNACAGSLTGIYILEKMISLGSVRCGLVVSGEFISHLADVAQKEIEGSFDDRMACLTLGDAGVAAILDKSPVKNNGFCSMNLFTGTGSKLCTATPTKHEHGGIVMNTNSLGIFRKSSKYTKLSINECLRTNSLTSYQSISHVVMHQVSRGAFETFIQTANSLVEDSALEPSKMVRNIATNGNTASTSHLLAFHQYLNSRQVKLDELILFAVQASGITTGSFLYKLRSSPAKNIDSLEVPNLKNQATSDYSLKIVGIETSSDGGTVANVAKTVGLSIKQSSISGIDVHMYTGLLKPDFIFEPAFSTMITEEAGLNDGLSHLAFDLINGDLAYLQAIYVASLLSQGNNSHISLISTSYIENTSKIGSTTATVLSSSVDRSGFSHFYFQDYTKYTRSKQINIFCEGSRTRLETSKVSTYEIEKANCTKDALSNYMKREKFLIEEIDFFIIPNFQREQRDSVLETFGLFPNRVYYNNDVDELKASNIPESLQSILSIANPGNRILIIQSCPGIQVGISIYTV